MKNFLYKSLLIISAFVLSHFSVSGQLVSNSSGQIEWEEMPPIPDALGVAGPFSGISNDFLIVAGGANFPQPVWDNNKQWVDTIYIMDLKAENLQWIESGRLPNATAYGASVSTPFGLFCFGGNNSKDVFKNAYVINIFRQTNKPAELIIDSIPSLPETNVYSQAVFYDNKIYLVTGQAEQGLDSAHKYFWKLDLTPLAGTSYKDRNFDALVWESLDEFPGLPRAFALSTIQHDGFDDHLFLASGRTQNGDETLFLTDHWKFNLRTQKWKKVSDVPQCVMAGVSLPVGQSHYLTVGGDTGENFFKTDDLKDNHPGFPLKSFAYNAITDTWSEHSDIPVNQVTTKAVSYKGSYIIPSGEIRPRVRSPKVGRLSIENKSSNLGWVNSVVIVIYLIIVLGVGFRFSRNHKNTDDYFTGGKRVAWWVAGCSVFATMLSSLTYTGIPSKAYAQNWVYAIANFMIPVVAIYAVFFALPFFRRLKSASAYEYLENRFDYRLRRVASGVFILYHIFRMAVVMSLTSLALSLATPLSPQQSIVIMGFLCIAYSVSGGLEAVVWTDTVQTVVLLIGAIAAVVYLIAGIDGGWTTFTTMASESDKFKMANLHWDATQSAVAFWVIVLGSIGQNISSYTSDQAVVQRYLSTPTKKDAAQAIWLNAGLSIFATLLFFGIGSGLFVFYKVNPDALDVAINNDQIFPFFIISTMPVGVAGLIIAGLFAAAQSTLSTSMNSTATALITDFASSRKEAKNDLFKARIATLVFGVMGTALAFLFISPEIQSLFDAFIKVVGLFMGTLGGLFLLGMLTKYATGNGALLGTLFSLVMLVAIWQKTDVPSFLYPLLGVVMSFLSGMIASKILPQSANLSSHSVK